MLTVMYILKPKTLRLGINATSQHSDLGFSAVTPPGTYLDARPWTWRNM
jgi:hypothetical protein